MRIASALSLALLAATPAAARFAPVAGATYRLAMTMERDDGKTARRFATDYDVTFARTGEGYRATLRPLPDSIADSRAGAAFRGLQSVADVAVRLDRDGRLIAVEDMDARWAHLREAIATTGGDTPRAKAARALLLAAHDAATPARRAETLAGDLLALCAGSDTDRDTATRTTTLPASDGTALPVRETVTREPGSIAIVTQDDAGTLVRRRRVDRRTGLVADLRETRRITARQDGATMAATTVRTARLTLMASPYPSGTARKP